MATKKHSAILDPPQRLNPSDEQSPKPFEPSVEAVYYEGRFYSLFNIVLTPNRGEPVSSDYLEVLGSVSDLESTALSRLVDNGGPILSKPVSHKRANEIIAKLERAGLAPVIAPQVESEWQGKKISEDEWTDLKRRVFDLIAAQLDSPEDHLAYIRRNIASIGDANVRT